MPPPPHPPYLYLTHFIHIYLRSTLTTLPSLDLPHHNFLLSFNAPVTNNKFKSIPLPSNKLTTIKRRNGGVLYNPTSDHRPVGRLKKERRKMTEPRRLKGHNATVTTCIASRERPGLVATADEDGCLCWFDLRCKDVLFVMNLGTHIPVSSLSFKPGNEDKMYASSGTEVKCYDLNMASSSWNSSESYNYNKDEINQVACSSKSSFLAAGDDAGDVKIIDIHQHCLYKTLRAGHSSICSSVQFLPWGHREVITGGLDSRLMIWDFSKGRSQKIVDFAMNDAGQSLNPAFVHCLAVPETSMVDRVGKICAVARGDGVVDVINIDIELSAIKSKNSAKSKMGTKRAPETSVSPVDKDTRRKLQLDQSCGGHNAAVSCVAFSNFGEEGKFVISGGNDRSIKVWDWSKTCDGFESNNGDSLCRSLDLKRKVNWLCTVPIDSENLVVCDTSTVVKVFTIT